ncbi:hypothetical protein CsSME_00027731 [Camellia sinensis var. sinensis]
MSQVSIKDDEVDIVIGALHSDLTSFMEDWRLTPTSKRNSKHQMALILMSIPSLI